jgi:hypothetical protein
VLAKHRKVCFALFYWSKNRWLLLLVQWETVLHGQIKGQLWLKSVLPTGRNFGRKTQKWPHKNINGRKNPNFKQIFQKWPKSGRTFMKCIYHIEVLIICSVAEPHHISAAPAPGTNFDAAPAAPAPILLYTKAKFLK